ncbi:MAG: HTH domain-containing protein [Pseudoruminococcus massiliensis]
MKEKVLLLLKEGEYISGEKLSEILGVSRTAIWKAINSLRDDGY